MNSEVINFSVSYQLSVTRAYTCRVVVFFALGIEFNKFKKKNMHSKCSQM